MTTCPGSSNSISGKIRNANGKETLWPSITLYTGRETPVADDPLMEGRDRQTGSAS